MTIKTTVPGLVRILCLFLFTGLLCLNTAVAWTTARDYTGQLGENLVTPASDAPAGKLANIVRVGGYNTSGYARHVQVVGHYAYVADEQVGLQILDVSNPAKVVRVGGYNIYTNLSDVQVVGNYAYVGDGRKGLQILDVSNPSHVMRVGGEFTNYYHWHPIAGKIRP